MTIVRADFKMEQEMLECRASSLRLLLKASDLVDVLSNVEGNVIRSDRARMGKWRKEPPQKEPLFRRAIHFLPTMSPSAEDDSDVESEWQCNRCEARYSAKEDRVRIESLEDSFKLSRGGDTRSCYLPARFGFQQQQSRGQTRPK